MGGIPIGRIAGFPDSPASRQRRGLRRRLLAREIINGTIESATGAPSTEVLKSVHGVEAAGFRLSTPKVLQRNGTGACAARAGPC